MMPCSVCADNVDLSSKKRGQKFTPPSLREHTRRNHKQKVAPVSPKPPAKKKLLLVTDNFGPNRFGKICAEVTFSVKENIKQAFLRERQIYSPSGTIVSFDSCS